MSPARTVIRARQPLPPDHPACDDWRAGELIDAKYTAAAWRQQKGASAMLRRLAGRLGCPR